MRRLLLVLCAALPLLHSCGDDVQYASPPKRADTSGGGHMPSGHPPTDGSTQKPAMPAGHPTGAGSASRPDAPAPIPTHGAADPFAEEGGGAKVEMPNVDPTKLVVAGEIVLGDGVKAPSPCFLFVSLVAGPQGRMPVLTKRYENVSFPFKFDLKYADNPTGQIVDVTKALHLRASISNVPDVFKATNKTNSPDPIKPGATDAKLVLK